jgi:hypothetical protein
MPGSDAITRNFLSARDERQKLIQQHVSQKLEDEMLSRCEKG